MKLSYWPIKRMALLTSDSTSLIGRLISVFHRNRKLLIPGAVIGFYTRNGIWLNASSIS